MSSQAPQLPLAVQLRDDASFANFLCTANNRQALQTVKQLVSSDEWLVYLWSNQPSGRSHLLQACCATVPSSFYLSLIDYQQLSPDVLYGLDDRVLICLDDIDCVTEDLAWQEALFHLYNRIKDKQGNLLIAANAPVQALNFSLTDLKSRLQAAVIFQLFPLSEEQKQQAIQLRAKQRGINASEEVLRFLLHHWPRDMRALIDALEQLDSASLIEKRKITIPFAKQILCI